MLFRSPPLAAVGFVGGVGLRSTGPAEVIALLVGRLFLPILVVHQRLVVVDHVAVFVPGSVFVWVKLMSMSSMAVAAATRLT